MATLGQQLRAAREAKGLSEKDAGSETKILTRIVVAMEADDFSGMAAPTYAKGFIRLYAGYLGLDPEPLIEEYALKYAPGHKTLMDEHSQLQKNSRPPVRFSFNLKWLSGKLNPKALTAALPLSFSNVWKKIFTLTPRKNTEPAPAKPIRNKRPGKDIRLYAGIAAGLLVLIVLVVSITNCSRRHSAKQAAKKPPVDVSTRNLLNEPLPDLYLVDPGKIESSR